MIADAFPLGEQVKLHTFDFKLYPKLWEAFNMEGTDFSEEVKNLPNDSG